MDIKNKAKAELEEEEEEEAEREKEKKQKLLQKVKQQAFQKKAALEQWNKAQRAKKNKEENKGEEEEDQEDQEEEEWESCDEDDEEEISIEEVEEEEVEEDEEDYEDEAPDLIPIESKPIMVKDEKVSRLEAIEVTKEPELKGEDFPTLGGGGNVEFEHQIMEPIVLPKPSEEKVKEKKLEETAEEEINLKKIVVKGVNNWVYSEFICIRM